VAVHVVVIECHEFGAASGLDMAAPTRLSAGLDRLGDANRIARALATLRVLTSIMVSAWQALV
jgi:hypothetical protein